MKEVQAAEKVYGANEDKCINVYLETPNDKDLTFFEKLEKKLGLILKVMAIGMSFIVFSIYFILLKVLSSEHGTQNNIKQFCYKTAKDFQNIEYFGKGDKFDHIKKSMLSIIDYTRKRRPSELPSLFNVTDRNFLFYGPPGTGKTHFVSKLVYVLDEELKKTYGDSNREYVKIYFITPSMIFDKYVGNTERNIAKLFEEARDTSLYKASIIFIDEIDAFFGDRDSIYNNNSGNLKTEFLNSLSGINEDYVNNCFLIGATNLKKNIDPAFGRRFGHKFEFTLPTAAEIKDILTNVTKSWKKADKWETYLKTASMLLESGGASQSLITTVCKRLVSQMDVEQSNICLVFYNAVCRAVGLLKKRKDGLSKENKSAWWEDPLKNFKNKEKEYELTQDDFIFNISETEEADLSIDEPLDEEDDVLQESGDIHSETEE